MELKKVFEMPQVEVIKFDLKDVITGSPNNGGDVKVNGGFDFNAIIKGEITNF